MALAIQVGRQVSGKERDLATLNHRLLVVITVVCVLILVALIGLALTTPEP